MCHTHRLINCVSIQMFSASQMTILLYYMFYYFYIHGYHGLYYTSTRCMLKIYISSPQTHQDLYLYERWVYLTDLEALMQTYWSCVHNYYCFFLDVSVRNSKHQFILIVFLYVAQPSHIHVDTVCAVLVFHTISYIIKCYYQYMYIWGAALQIGWNVGIYKN